MNFIFLSLCRLPSVVLALCWNCVVFFFFVFLSFPLLTSFYLFSSPFFKYYYISVLKYNFTYIYWNSIIFSVDIVIIISAYIYIFTSRMFIFIDDQTIIVFLWIFFFLVLLISVVVVFVDAADIRQLYVFLLEFCM